MAADYIAVDRTKPLGNQLVRAASLLREVKELVDQLNDIGQHCFAAADFTVFEARFGLAAGTGANTLTLLGLINTLVNTATDVTGALRSSQIEEFVSRLSGQ